MPHLARIRLHPIKSLDAVEVAEARVLASGALEHDRRFALFDGQGRVVNGKRTALIQTIRARYDLAAGTVELASEGAAQSFHLDGDRAALEQTLSDHLRLRVTVREDTRVGFPDDLESPGPTIVCTASLREVAGWYADISLEQARERFRANLEIDGDEPFWDDQLYSETDAPVRFRIGAVEFFGNNPCARCIVPTRNPISGEKTPGFAAVFEARRQETLPYWATRSRFDHFYRLAVNTRPMNDRGGVMRVGDELEILQG